MSDPEAAIKQPHEAAPTPFLEISGLVSIPFLSSSPEGFQLATRQSLLRHAPGTPLPEAKRIHGQENLQRRVSHIYPRALERTSEGSSFANLTRENTQDIQERVLQRSLPNARQEVPTDQLIHEDGHLRLIPGFTPLVGLRSIEQHGNELVYDTTPVTYRSYVAISSPHESQESLEVANPTGTACILFTTEPDGSKKIILQYRKPFDEATGQGNKLYGGIPGASIAGMLDGQLDPKNRGRLLPVDAESIRTNNIQELEEEFGLGKDDIFNVTINGLARDEIKIHNEFLLSANTPLSADEFAKKVGSQRAKDTEYHFSEQFIVIDGTPEAIEKLLTKVQCPLPPTHLAAFFAAGYHLALETYHQEKAQEWKTRVAKDIEENYNAINAQAKKFWHNQGIMAQTGYDPKLPPEQQGLPSLHSELQRTELIGRAVEHTWIFDVDGVVTNPQEKRITQPEMISELIKRLQKGEPVALVTGRALTWVERQVLEPLQQAIQALPTTDPAVTSILLNNLYVSGEFGGSSLSFENGQARHHIDPAISVPQEVLDRAREITAKYSGIVFTDEEKQTQFTSELQRGMSIEDFQKTQRAEIAEEYRKMLLQASQQGIDISHLEVHEDAIAINIRDRNANKRYAVRQVLQWLKDKKITAVNFYAFGDSPSDLEMGIELHSKHLPFTFAYTGKLSDIVGRPLEFPVIYPQEPTTPTTTDKGTVDILRQLDTAREAPLP